MNLSGRRCWLKLLAVAVLTLAGCGPRAAIQLSATGPTLTPECAGEAARPAVPAVAKAFATSAVAKVAPAGVSRAGETPTSIPRPELVQQAVATATAVARIPTPTPTSTRTPQPVCGTPTSRPTARAEPKPTTAPAPAPQAQVVGPAPRPDERPSPASVPSLASPVASLVAPTVLLPSDAGKLILLHVADHFVLLLGQYTGVDWQIQMSDPSILQRISSDGQGVYEAVRAGRTTLTATGTSACMRAQPPCLLLRQSRSLLFTIRVT